MKNNIRRCFEKLLNEDKELRVREWAAGNAYSLIFIAVMFVLTWILMVYLAAV